MTNLAVLRLFESNAQFSEQKKESEPERDTAVEVTHKICCCCSSLFQNRCVCGPHKKSNLRKKGVSICGNPDLLQPQLAIVFQEG